MKRSERILRLPSLEVSLQTAGRILEIVHALAEGHADSEAEGRLRAHYREHAERILQMDPDSKTEDLFVSRHLRDQQYRSLMNLPPYEKYTFISRTENVEFQTPQFELKDLPADVQSIYIRVDGVARFIEIRMNAGFRDFNQATDRQLNQVLIQGTDSAWVSGAYHDIEAQIAPEKKYLRTFVYSNARPIFWIIVTLTWVAEYSLAKLSHPSFNISAPLSGTEAVVLFGVLLGTILFLGNIVIPIYRYWFPYFELENNISRSRIASRKFVTGLIAAFLTGELINAASLIFGGAISRVLGG